MGATGRLRLVHIEWADLNTMLDEWTVVRPLKLGGFTAAALYEDEEGTRWVVAAERLFGEHVVWWCGLSTEQPPQPLTGLFGRGERALAGLGS